jgi:VanZ family protein
MRINIMLMRNLAVFALLIVLAGIFIGGTMPGAGNLFTDPWDKVAHFMAFAGITLLAGLALPNRSLTLILLLAVSVGIADEVHQLFLDGRQAGLDDLLADILGALFALPLIALIRRYAHNEQHRWQIQ